MQIPIDERAITDSQVFQALDLDYPGLEQVKVHFEKGDLAQAKRCLLQYFETRNQTHYFFDYRSLPLIPIETDEDPYIFQASLGLSGSLKEFCLYAGKKMAEEHVYVIPGKGRGEIPLGKDFETPLHFSFLKDKGKRFNDLNLFVRGTVFEYLYVLYHETGNRDVLSAFEDFLRFFLDTYPLVICNTEPDAARFQFEDDRDVMSAGFLTLSYTGMLYTRIPYELDPDLAFEVIKRIWFIGIQYRRFDKDSYRPYNHHMWERGLVPFILGTMFPEFPDFAPMKEIGAKVICQHVKDDFNEAGGYNEHSIAYWSGAALGEMLYRGIYLARVNHETLLDEESEKRLTASFQILAQIAPPQERYPSLGDNQGPEVSPILTVGVNAFGHPACREVLEIRKNRSETVQDAPLDYCNDQSGFVCGKSGYGKDANYFLMSAKNNCGYTGHNHMDMLSLFITLHGASIVEEPDSGLLYHKVRLGSPHRGYMYNMTSHNTILAFGNPIAPDPMYADSWGVYRPDSPVSAFISRPEGMFVEAFHQAYTFCRHNRSVLFSRKNGLIVRDSIDRGNRFPADHIQRWHLAKNVAVKELGGQSLLLSAGEVQVLCIWNRPAALHIYQNPLLYPEMVSDPQNLSTVIDLSFRGEKNETLDYEATALSTAFLDITGCGAESLDLEKLQCQLFPLVESSDMEKAIRDFDRIALGNANQN